MKRKKMIKRMLKHLEAMLGEEDAGMVLAILCDALNKMVAGVEQRELRTLKITLNEYFAAGYDFDKEQEMKL